MWTFRQSFMCLIGSTLATLILSLGGYAIWKHWHSERISNEKYKIVAIVQTGPEKDALKTSYLAEILGLSVDRPTLLYAFDRQIAEQALLSCPFISKAKIQRIVPGTIYIDYALRKPIAWLADYQNTGIDIEGHFFPIAPFYSPKNLPEIYLGLPPFDVTSNVHGRIGGSWQISLENPPLALAFEILRLLEEAPWREGMRIKRIDVSNIQAPSAGHREIVLLTEDELTVQDKGRELVCIFPKILRLPVRNYKQQLSNFLTLRRTMLDDYLRQIVAKDYQENTIKFATRIIDLRISQYAFVENK